MIEKKRDEWFSSSECTVCELVDYIEKTGYMRDAQIEAIRTYLYLKIACDNRPLIDLFTHGFFNSILLDELELSVSTRVFLQEHPEAAALYEYASIKNDVGEQVSKKLEARIKKDPESIDYKRIIRDIFYGVTYTDYLFSLPMGAGKTYLMAAFIYLDLYFARLEPWNKAFAHNFMIFAPSGLKSSVVPSLKTIQRFNPSWVLPEPAASEIKRIIAFEVLDQESSAKKSNRTRNPNVQKIASHQPLSELFGFVAVTNAEKVILDRVQTDKNHQYSLLEESEDLKDKQANELRNLIGKLPSLAIFIDEVHHAVNDEIKLRAVVNHWQRTNTINSVIGFSGTPYLEKAEKILVAEKLFIANTEISNTVFYYPIVAGIGNFLKRPLVKIADLPERTVIIEEGIRDFLNHYIDTVYEGNLCAKIGIYCGTIETLEEIVYPLVSRVAAEFGIKQDQILRFHKGNKQYQQPVDSQLQFDSLDKPLSNIRIVLLVQIGKEGWDCRSLTGIILSQEGDCPKNMVLQTSCRCLRQVSRNHDETALIWLNKTNGEKLEDQLKQQHHISIKEFEAGNRKTTILHRFDRTKHLRLPKIDFYQLRVNYIEQITEMADPGKKIPEAIIGTEESKGVIRKTDFNIMRETSGIEFFGKERGDEPASLFRWLRLISKESFGTLAIADLLQYEKALRIVFNEITYLRNDQRYFSSQVKQAAVRSNIRKAFSDNRTFSTTEELIPQESNLLKICNFTDEIHTEHIEEYYPSEKSVQNIILEDKGKLKRNPTAEKMIEQFIADGKKELAEQIRREYASFPNKDRSFHYLPYRTDSSFEQTFLTDMLSLSELESLNLEVYYNGDRAMTEFKIKCYKRHAHAWNYIGMYTPDFLIIQRERDKIHKIIIVETKGKVYSNDPTFVEKRRFMEEEFLRENNKAFGYYRFEYLYLEDSLDEKERLLLTHQKVISFFGKED